MLTIPERIIFLIASLLSLYAAYRIAQRIYLVLRRGQGSINWGILPKRLVGVLLKTATLKPTWRIRFGVNILHAFIAWAFITYLLVNLADVLEALVPGFRLSELLGPPGGFFRLSVDLLSAAALVGMSALLIRRFLIKPADLNPREDILLHPKARNGIRRDSAIVGGFILVHIGSRFLGQSILIAVEGIDPWQPFASSVSSLWNGMSETSLIIGIHLCFWLAIGTILLFIPYFLISKHIHLFFAPINYLLKPERRSPGELSPIDFENDEIEQFGATRLEDLGWEQIMDAYACIMCYRCQQVCPAYNTGKVLSPAALEINKRYFLNQEGAQIAKGEVSSERLLDFAITPEAVWACTACGACTDICPVGNEPMRDILDIRRALVLMENDFPDTLQTAFRGMERTANPWNISPAERMSWADGLQVPLIVDNPNPEILWWVGCAPATDPRAQKTARAFAKILASAGVNYAVLGEQESCTGDSARRAGNEYLFFELAASNIEMLNEISPPRIVTTCPHCLHTLKNEYPAFNGNYDVIHHTQFISELIAAGKLNLDSKPGQPDQRNQRVTFHDPCYLGRQNNILAEPRQVIKDSGDSLLEINPHGRDSFCCGAGGAQVWKEEEHGKERVNLVRFRQALETNAEVLAVGCPFCMIMLDDARTNSNREMEILDIAEIVAQKLEQVDD